SRIISGKMQLEKGIVDLKQSVGAALDAIGAAAEAKEVRVTAHVDPTLRPIEADPARIQQVISNLLSNAVKFTPALGRADIHVEQKPAGVEIRVSDTGRGIEPHFLPRVFERFQQADSSTTRPESGLGLGLAIVRHLVVLHQGSVEAHSAGPGEGATFVVRLPEGAQQGGLSNLTTARARLLRAAPPSGQLQNLQLVVVDDDPDAREAIASALRAAGAVVHPAQNVRDALARIEQGGIDVVVSDIGMPFEDGYSLIRRLRQNAEASAERVAALALTAYASVEDQRRALAAGYDGFVAKPAAAGELIATVARLAKRTDPGDGASSER
ncbi:MAG TPA: ATP-binding protein, partial [Myxococcota bacterium]|nr:ATP-binding protein [Myxococcota bacterium]